MSRKTIKQLEQEAKTLGLKFYVFRMFRYKRPDVYTAHLRDEKADVCWIGTGSSARKAKTAAIRSWLPVLQSLIPTQGSFDCKLSDEESLNRLEELAKLLGRDKKAIIQEGLVIYELLAIFAGANKKLFVGENIHTAVNLVFSSLEGLHKKG